MAKKNSKGFTASNVRILIMAEQKVFCIGLSRTGTTSICEALSILGYRTKHFPFELYVHPEIVSPDYQFVPKQNLGSYSSWCLKKELKAIDSAYNPNMLEEYDAFGDLPVPLFYKELDEKFVNSKFIYTYRDEKKWLNSMKWLLSDGAVLWSHGLINRDINLAVYRTKTFDEKKLLKSYRDHHNEVNDYFAARPNDLLKVNIDSTQINFTTICDYLGSSVPEISFPRSNASTRVSGRKRISYWMKQNIPFYSILNRKIQLKY